MASRTGSRLTPSSSANSSWRSAEPGGMRPERMRSRNSSTTRSTAVLRTSRPAGAAWGRGEETESGEF
ncbi:hypothetical protein G6F40_018270 [Rhizopus arrhizus]|nr:hypothetical protein G6F40_018270 [Rhizopus arrhizus]